MIVDYHRPKSIEEAIQRLSMEDRTVQPLGGGTALTQKGENVSVVDLQDLDLNWIKEIGNTIQIGATTTLHQIERDEKIYPALRNAIRNEANFNFRQMATIAGATIEGTGRSPLLTVLLALAVKIKILPDDLLLEIGEMLPFQADKTKGKLITSFHVPSRLKVTYQYVARTPADRPIVCVSAAKWASGRTRVALGGFGASPLLAFDGPNAVGVEMAVKDAYSEAGDPWGSAEYRSEIATILVKRCLKQM